MGRDFTLLFWLIYISFRVTDGCQLQGITPGLTRVPVNIFDVDRGDIYSNQVISITGVIDIVQSGLNSGPYISGHISETTFYLTTSANYEQYEELETLDTFTLTAQFRCSDGSAITQVFQINVQDTNNNSPVFLPSNEYDIAIATPLLPGHQITGCQHNIVVRDIDLTTYRIDFALTGSDLFEIEYDEASSTNAKEFVAILRTSTFIRTLPEPVELTISATDVDRTGDDPRTSYATVRITADSDAEFPEEPVFYQPLYTATYTEEHTIILDESISLQQGYHELVDFTLNEEYSSYFGVIRDGNNVSLNVTTPLSADILIRQQIYLVIRAHREFTSGATATIVVQLPEEIGLQFERSNYEGIIEDNTLVLSNLILVQGYERVTVSVTVSNDFFLAEILGNVITLSMQPLTQEIIDENTYLNLEVVARTERSVASTVVTLEIVKNDTITPIFQRPVYIGSYSTNNVLNLEQIELIQGFDDTVEITLDGEYSDLFRLNRNGYISTLSVDDSLPLEELGEQTIILTIHARKFRTVGASASIYITLPEEIILQFERENYEGTITDNVLEVSNIVLSQGFENNDVSVNVSNELFSTSIEDNIITLTMMELTNDIIWDSSYLNLIVMATTTRSWASTVVTLAIIKNDTATPLFENALYSASYSADDVLTIQPIIIIQGYDDSVEVTLDGEHANLFQLMRNEESSTLTAETIPPIIFSERNIALTVIATKPRTVGSSAVINIALPTDRILEFGATTYRGIYQNDNLSVETLTIITGYENSVNFTIDGDYMEYFTFSNTLNEVTIELLEPLPNSVIFENNFLQLTVSASGLNALSTTASLVIEIIKDDLTTPLFTQNIYSGAFTDGIIEIQNMSLVQGFDSTVSFRLDGDDSQYFSIIEEENEVTLMLSSIIPEDVIFNQKTLVFSILAEKPLTVGANSAIVITFPSELTDLAVMRFSQNTYVGSLDHGVLNLPDLILNTGYTENVQFFLTGDLSSYFTLSHTNEIVSITATNVPEDVIQENKFIILEVEARRNRAISVFSTIVIELIHEDTTATIPVFNAAYYRGSFDLEENLQFSDEMYLLQGYDDSVTFELEGEFSNFFSVTDNNNHLNLSVHELPEDVWNSNQQIIFTLIAKKPGDLNGSAAVIIDMPKEVDENLTILGFERSSYIGSIDNDVVTVQPITLTEGYTEDVIFTIFGDLSNFFTFARNGATIILQTNSALPEESIPTNGIIVLGVQASTAADTLPAVTTVILEVIRETPPVSQTLEFGQTYYVGTYTATTDNILEHPISLSEGYDENVQFTLVGDSSIYFTITRDGNSLNLTASEAIPPGVIANNNQLIFIINAQSPNGATAQATIVILLPNEVDENLTILGFERSSYIGSIDNDVVTIQPITLTEGYTEDVIFTIFGDLSNFFTFARNGATIILQTNSALPEESIPTNGIIVLGVQASTAADTLPAVTTVILEVIRETPPVSQTLEFGQTYYVGTYTATTDNILEHPISLSEGYDENVQFTLVGDSSIYFTITRDGNSLNLTASEAIPPGVIANNNQLIFIINAQSPNGATAQATIVILLPNEVDENLTILGFERSSYIGSIDNDVVTIQPITLTEGYTEDVIFTIFGDLSNFFTFARNGATIILQTNSALPEESIPTNGIIVLGVQASTAADTLPAVTTVILEVIRETPPVSQTLEFGQTYYVGTYTATTDNILEHPISLSEGYDENVQFTLVGDSSIYFTITRDGNSLNLTASEAIPPGVIANNNQLIFIINAQSPNGATAQATIVILLPNEVDENLTILGFERSSYIGSIDNDVVTVQPITLTEGYTEDVIFTIFGDLSNFFTFARNGATIILQTNSALPEESIPTNGIIVLGVQASTAADTLPAVTTVILEVIRETPPVSQTLEFGQTYYVGTYTATTDNILEHPISLSEGYDENVQFTLVGDSSIYFTITRDGNSLNLTASEAIPPGVIANNNQLIFIINAQSPNGATAQATIVILLPNEVDENLTILGFERSSYIGSIDNDVVTVQPITLTEGYTEDVIFTIFGDLSNFFTFARNGATIILQTNSALPEESIPTNGIIVLGVQASTAADTLPAVTTVILEVIRETPPVSQTLEFGQTYYVGTYTATTDNILEHPISLSEGYDENVQFTLVGDSSIYFTITRDGNSLNLTASEAIPPGVIANNNQLIFIINAQSPNGATAQATIVILLPNEVDESLTILGFERSSYIGSIDNDVVTIQPITLTEGYTEDVIFTIFGDLSNFFTFARNGATIILQTNSALPEESIPTNGLIVLGVQASTAADTLPAVTTVILEVIRETPPVSQTLEFGQTYYVGTYTATTDNILEHPISLSEGYDENVQFTLVGDSSIYFTITQDGNSLNLTASEAIPPGVIANNNQLIFIINAQSPNGATAQATIVILLPNEVDENLTILGFERSSYIGSIDNDVVTIQPITLTEGYTEDVIFTIFGDLSNFFTFARNGATIILQTNSALPEESIPTNGIIVLGVQASTAADTLPAVTTVILEVIRETPPVSQTLEFGQTYYVGTYTATTDNILEHPISLSEGYDENVQFTLVGDSSIYFTITRDGNSLNLTASEAIPPGVIANNNQLIFIINAQSPNGATAQATIVILLPNEVDENLTILGFERSSYIGSIDNDVVTIQPITLTEGYTEDVIFTIFGDLSNFFTFARNGATIILQTNSALPEESIPTNGIIVLGVQASTAADTLPAVTTVILEVIRETPPVSQTLEFGQTYYVGTYTATTDNILEHPISLSEGYDENVQFTLVGDSSIYFTITRDGNSLNLTASEAIPPGVIANNNQLIFIINAQSPNGATAQATIVILLPNEVDENLTILGFERSSYIGSIDNDVVTIQPITLTEGYTEDVIFTIFGDLSNFFTFARNGATIILQTNSALPEESIPTNGIIVLGVQASTAADTLPAVTTVILEVIRETPPVSQTLEFGQTYYVGTYTATTDNILEHPMSLSEGYDENVQFTLVGDSSIYFIITRDGNSLNLTAREAIPPGVIANNNQLIFIINAQSPNGATAQATIVILLPNEVDENLTILGFERSSYIGSIDNDVVTIQPITLTEGYTEDVIFTIFGDLSNFFTFARNGATIILQTNSALPEESIPTNGIIVLGVQASTAADTLPAVTTVILEVIRETPPVSQTLEFGQTYYVGTYTATTDNILEHPISLSEGYDENVQFTLVGDSSIYFTITRDGNSLNLTASQAIPPGVITNNNQLIFIINAQSPNGATAQATIVILLPNEVDENLTILGFERSSYIGSIDNDVVTVQPITLTEGYTEDVIFTIFGDLSNFFTFARNGATIILQTNSALPEESIPTNGIIVLGVQASTAADTLPAVTTVILEVIRETPPVSQTLEFGQTYYVGTYTATTDNILDQPISLSEGYDENVQFTLVGDSSIYFTITRDGNSLNLTASEAIPPGVIANNNQLIFIINAQSPNGASAQATIVILLPNEVDENLTILGFERYSYIGSIDNDVVTVQPITLTEGYTEDVIFTIFGDLSNFFTFARNGATIILQTNSALPEESIPTNGIIVLGVQASTAADTLPAVTTVILEVIRETPPVSQTLEFGQTYYVGTYTATTDNILDHPISLSEGYDENVQFTLVGDSSIYFTITRDGNSLNLTASEAIPPGVIANNNQLIFIINAQSPNGATAQATIVILIPNEVDEYLTILGFERSSYIGSIDNDVVTIQPITLTEGYTEDVIFTIFGDLSNFFTFARNGATIILQTNSALPEESIPTNGIIVLGVQASTAADTLPAVTTVILEVIRETPPVSQTLEFGQTYYVGTYTATTDNILEHPISLSEGYDENVQFTLVGDSSIYFTITRDGNSLNLTASEAIPPGVIANNNQLIFIINAQSPNGATAQATIVILLPNEVDENLTILGFDRSSYIGSIDNDVVTIQPITLIEGYTEDVDFILFGELQSFFDLSRNGATVSLYLLSHIPEDMAPVNGIIILEIHASKVNAIPAAATIVIEIERSGASMVTFSKVLYEGIMQAGTVQHESITITGYDATIVVIKGDYAELFTASLSEGLVTVQQTGSVTLPIDITHVALEIHIENAAAVLLLQVLHTDTPIPPPTVTFTSSSYVLRAEVLQTGVIGRVTAFADNGESLIYSAAVDDSHLAARIAVNSDGELLVSSPVNVGEYTFQVVATTLITQAIGEATVYLTVDETSIIFPPLIVLDRDEEEAYENLVVFNASEYANCSYTLTNRFPTNQDWLYIDGTGLHARSIDREDPSIAFMALSQIQVEIEVHCASLTRNKRSVSESRLDWLGPYDYGTSTWILGESIAHNPRRSVVNLIVNDINDNSPIFIERDNEPVAVGYPVPELEDIVLPRALAQLQATDADVGENAALIYWSAEPVLAVSPTSGSVHVQDDSTLEEGQMLVVHATDRNGAGLSGAITLMVKLLNVSNIAVITIRDAFLEDEPRIIANLSDSVGYNVRVLRAVVISDETERIEENLSMRKKRQTVGGATLELFVYGLIEREPVAADLLIEAINNNAAGAVSIADSISLEDHLDARQIHSSERDVGLLVATIVLSVLLFILIVAILIWFFLKWRKGRKYEEFSDENSLESRNESIVQPPKVDVRPKPRINIDELKRSERRLQEMIDAPYNEVAFPTTSTKEAPVESVVDISQTDSNVIMPIVIKDKLKDADEDLSDVDEFGEVKRPRRKSVVTFNENVEKIIHVDDSVEGSSTTSDVEIFRF
ncbi:uncharacterized protein LOC106133343 isoform X3 [Amyelois transitella]|uniref:uncharacterized protein LOC106133343 isoform X3 n=1 Tax=Amyelois transitella TaxID=680683 RepID=UPI00298F5705|nr:uncharacterized protein LOC106133343 isoform X3 [Amyelois transitella]